MQGEFPTHLHGKICLLAGAPNFLQTVCCGQCLTDAETMTQLFLLLPDEWFASLGPYFIFAI